MGEDGAGEPIVEDLPVGGLKTLSDTAKTLITLAAAVFVVSFFLGTYYLIRSPSWFDLVWVSFSIGGATAPIITLILNHRTEKGVRRRPRILRLTSGPWIALTIVLSMLLPVFIVVSSVYLNDIPDARAIDFRSETLLNACSLTPTVELQLYYHHGSSVEISDIKFHIGGFAISETSRTGTAVTWTPEGSVFKAGSYLTAVFSIPPLKDSFTAPSVTRANVWVKGSVTGDEVIFDQANFIVDHCYE